MREASRCKSCHTRREEWDESKGGDRKAYVAHLDRCPGCEQIQYEQEKYAHNKNLGKGIYIALKKPDRP